MYLSMYIYAMLWNMRLCTEGVFLCSILQLLTTSRQDSQKYPTLHVKYCKATLKGHTGTCSFRKAGN